MTATRLVFVPAAGDALPPDPATTQVVLDTTWTPGPGAREDLVPLRGLAGDALRAADLFEEALALLDAWADEAGMVDLLTLDGVTYWYRLRETAWHWLHERLIWERVLAAAAGSGAAGSGAGDAPGPGGAAVPHRPRTIVVPGHETALREVAEAAGRARGVDVAVAAEPETPAGVGPTTAPTRTPSGQAGQAGGRRLDLGRLSGLVRRVAGSGPGHAPAAPRSPDAAPASARVDALAERLRNLAAEPVRPILVLTNTRLRQRIGGPAARRVEDPSLGPVIERLREVGLDPVLVGLGLDESRNEDWAVVASDARLLPQSVLRRWRGPEDAASRAADEVRERVGAAAAIPLDVHGVDLAPALTAWLGGQAATVVGTILRQLPRIAGLLDDVQPRGIVLTHEALQTAWLQVARARSVPVFAVQHGMIYPTHPGYRHPRDARLLLPGRTFVTGQFERDVLLAHGGYEPDEVVVVGAPRLSMAGSGVSGGSGPLSLAERDAVRRELGVAEGDRMLVVSTGFLPLQRRFVLAASFERLFGEALPGVHVVFKQHPGEADDGPYRDLLVGLAQAGGFAPPPVTVVRDVDLYRLLRAADAHLGLLSTVLSDAVAAGTPNLVAVDQAHTDLLGYVAAGVARPIRTAAELRVALDDPLPPDEAARRAFLAAHLEPGPAAERIVAHVMAVLGGPATSTAAAARSADTGSATAAAAPARTAPARTADTGGTSRRGIELRRARSEDARHLFAWANDPATRAASFDRPPIAWDEHVAWLAAVLADPERRLWIAEDVGVPVGQLRVDRATDGVGVVSIGLAPAARGRGTGRAVLRLGVAAALRELGIRRARAVVMAGNEASRRLFEGAGFVVVSDAEAGAPGRAGGLVLEVDAAAVAMYAAAVAMGAAAEAAEAADAAEATDASDAGSA